MYEPQGYIGPRLIIPRGTLDGGYVRFATPALHNIGTGPAVVNLGTAFLDMPLPYGRILHP